MYFLKLTLVYYIYFIGYYEKQDIKSHTSAKCQTSVALDESKDAGVLLTSINQCNSYSNYNH